MFTPGSDSLYDFFNKAGVAYYIPFYQRQYSWDKEDVEKLMDDLYDGVRKICNQSDYLRFIGTVILLKESNPNVGTHYDSNGLITQIKNVIDGQQRLCTISVLSILLSIELDSIKNRISLEGWETIPTVSDLVTTIDNKLLDLEEFFSLEVRKTNVVPVRKPIIIRAYDNNSNPVADQWTLNGDYRRFYKSDVSRFIAHYIEAKEPSTEIANEKLISVINEIKKWLTKTRNGTNFPNAEDLVAQNTRDGSLEGFIDGEIDLPAINQGSVDCFNYVCGAIKILALLRFLTHKTFLTWIECPNEDLAFDMFQSLNATGTPLTAIEVFKPLVVNTLGINYGDSQTKEFFDKIDNFFDKRKTSADKEKLTDEVLIRFALGYNGFELGKRFSEQRDYLTKSYNEASSLEKKESLVRWLYYLTEYWENIYVPRQPNRNTQDFKLVNHLISLGLNVDSADLSALCIYYLKGANHSMAHYLIAVFYAKLLKSKHNDEDRETASSEFLEICRTAAAFFTLWGATLSGFPDEIYRNLFQDLERNISWKEGEANQTSQFVKLHFMQALEQRGVFSLTSKENAKRAWMERATNRLGYGKKTLCRFSLFIAAHDKSPDLNTGNEGLVVNGTGGCSPYLSCEKWFSEDYEVVEHIANRDKPQAPYKYREPDAEVYRGDYSVVDKIGNLTLWSRSANSSTYPEWPDKVYYYSTLTSLTPQQPVDLRRLKDALGINTEPPGLAQAAASTNYIANLAPLALRGQNGLNWSKDIIDRRTENICDMVFEHLYDWLIT